MNTKDLTQLVEAFGDAFNRGDLDAVMELLSDKPTFLTSAGDEVCGTRITGRMEVRKAFESTLDAMPDAHWKTTMIMAEGDTAVSHWILTGTNRYDGKRMEVEGCDIMNFENDKMTTKNAFRKDRPTF